MCSDESVSLLGLVPPGSGERLDVSVVTSESVDSAFDKNESELGVLVSSALLQMLSDVHSLFDQVVKVFWDAWSKANFLQDSEDFAAGAHLDLWNTNSVPKSDADLGWRVTLLSKLDNGVDNVVGRDIHP